MNWEAFKCLHPQLAAFYVSVTACADGDRCPAITNCPSRGDWPRGWYTEASLPVRVLVVLENPGPSTAEEKQIGNRFQLPEALAARSFETTMRTMQAIMSAPPRSLSEVPRETGGPHRVTRAHRGLVYVLSEILGVDPKDVYKAAAHTNAVKCSGNTGLRNSENGKQTLIHGGNKFLRDEIQIYNPKILLALSRDSESALRQLGLKTPIAFVPHPQSWRGRTLATVPKRIRAAREALLLAEG